MAGISLAIHGGAGTLLRSVIRPEQEAAYRQSLQVALDTGYKVLEQGGTALEAVKRTVMVLEDDPLFNAGRGSVFTNKGDHEMDASIMDGATLGAGAVGGLKKIKNPVLLAEQVMLHSGHVLLGEKVRWNLPVARDWRRNRRITFIPNSGMHNGNR